MTLMPDSFEKTNQIESYKAVEIDGNGLLLSSPFNKDRLD